MTNRERMLAVVQGRMPDRVPFVQYDGIAAPNEEVWKVIGRENMGILRWTSVCSAHTANCRWESEDICIAGTPGVRRFLHTPKGTIYEEKLFEPTYGTGSTRRHFIQERDDYFVLMSYFEDMVIVEDVGPFMDAVRALWEDGLPHVSLGRTPYQQLWIQWVSLENLAIHMADWPDLLEDVMAIMGRRLRETFEIVRRVPVPYVVFGDNITAPAIGEQNFRRYCLPYYKELAEMLADRDVPVYVHADGDLKPLWKAIGESSIGGLDSLSPPPDNDTSVEDAVKIWPGMRLGVNFPSSIHLAQPDVIRETAVEMLNAGAKTGRLQIQISENVPPGVWRKSYPVIVDAIRDFGTLSTNAWV